MTQRRARTGDERLVATSMVLAAIASVQLGAAIATTLFDEVGPGGAVFLRSAFAAVVLLAIWRPRIRSLTRPALREVAVFGLVLAVMNLCFYLAIDRIPLGIAVTLEFVGPLGVALIRSRRHRDLIWVALAAAGLILLTPTPGSGLDALGCAFALLAGVMWGTYIVLGARLGQTFAGGDGITLAMCVSAVLLIPALVVDGAGAGADASLGLLAVGLVVAVLSSALPYSLEIESLRRLPEGVFGVLMSLEPGVAAIVGFFALDQDLAGRELVAIGLVLAASAGALSQGVGEPPVSD